MLKGFLLLMDVYENYTSFRSLDFENCDNGEG